MIALLESYSKEQMAVQKQAVQCTFGVIIGRPSAAIELMTHIRV